MERVGAYELDALIGRGASGSVWRAHRAAPVRQSVAVKRARTSAEPSARSRLRHEATILADLDHPHILRVMDVLDDDGDVAIVMQLARGGSLEDLLAERGTLSPGQVVAVLAPVADALGSAHRRGVLHGDVKPANILFTSDGEPLLSDFGVARTLRAGDGFEGEVAGTAPYLDPEVLDTGRPTPGSDMYAVAVVAYIALTGRLPHGGDDAEQILGAADRGSHRSLLEDPSIPTSLAQVVESALARDPRARPRRAEDLADALRSVLPPSAVELPGPAVGVDLDDMPAPAADGVHRTRPFGPRPPRPGEETVARDRRGVAVALLAGVALSLLALVLLVDRGQHRDRRPEVTTDGTSQPQLTCPRLRPLVVPEGGARLEADLRGDGCPVSVVWDGAVAQFLLSPQDVSPRRYDFKKLLGARQVRKEGGRLLVGDWDCDGADSPALYDPATGTVHYFDAVPIRVGGELAADHEDRTGIEEGQVEVRPGAAGDCDVVVVGRSA